MNKKSTQRIIITKSTGDQVPFDEDKLRFSLQRSKADAYVIEDIITEIKNQLYPTIKTKEIYKRAFDLLKKYSRPYGCALQTKKSHHGIGSNGFSV
jgi:transcriptional regulator NrdR family protein